MISTCPEKRAGRNSVGNQKVGHLGSSCERNLEKRDDQPRNFCPAYSYSSDLGRDRQDAQERSAPETCPREVHRTGVRTSRVPLKILEH